MYHQYCFFFHVSITTSNDRDITNMSSTNKNDTRADAAVTNARPCCPCVKTQKLSEANKILWSIFGISILISLALLVPGIVLLSLRNKSSSQNTAGIVLTVLGSVFTVGSMGPLIAAIAVPTLTVMKPDLRVAGCRPCECSTTSSDTLDTDNS